MSFFGTIFQTLAQQTVFTDKYSKKHNEIW